jgi:RDD family
MKIKLVSQSGKPIDPMTSLLRTSLVHFPFYNEQIGQFFSEGTPMVIGIVYILIVVVFGTGISIFTVFNPSVRGLHDLIAKTFVIPISSTAPETNGPLSLKPIIACAVCALVWAGILFQGLRSMPSTDDIKALNDRIKTETKMDNLSAGYRSFEINGKREWYAVVVYIPVAFDIFKNEIELNELKNRIYTASKKVNTNSEVDSVFLTIYSKKFYGLIPFKQKITDRKRLTEIL